MKKCIKCGTRMIEDLNTSNDLYLTSNNKKIAKVYFCVCPKCGNIEIYVKDINALEKINIKNSITC